MTIPKQDERTPGPWSLDESSKRKDLIYCDDATGSVVARCGGLGFEYVGRSQAECEANARFIVQAVNAYTSTDALRSALAGTIAVLESVERDTNYGIHDEYEPRDKCTCELCKARAALSGSAEKDTA